MPSQVVTERAANVESLKFDAENRSQWLAAAPFRSAFCIAMSATPANWTIEVLLPNGQTAVVGSYDLGNLFEISMPRYITTSAMCEAADSIRFGC
ncbi:MAG: hypothetical protein R3C03_23565 [Pirellulaceae bacterium]